MKKRFKIILFIYIHIIIFSITLNANSKINFTQVEKEFIQKNKIIKVHNELDWAPYNYNENGESYGYSIDYMRLIASKAGFKIDFVSGYSWSQFMDMIKKQEIDVMLNITKTDKREKYLSFTTPYIKQIDVVFTKKGVVFNSLKELNGKKISVVDGFYEQEMLEEYYPNIKLVVVKSSFEALKLVSFGKVDATLNNLGAGSYLIAKYGLLNIEPTLEIKDKIFHINLHMATNIKNKILRDILEKAKKKVTKEETVRLTKKWLSHNNNLRTSLTLKEIDYLSKKKVITMCIDPNWMPFESFDKKGRYIGISADYFKHFENIMKLNFKIIKTKSWAQSLKFAKSRKCDILALAMATPKREKYLNFTEPYLEVPIVIATKNNISFIENMESLSNKRIAITKGYAFTEIIKQKYPNIKLVEVKNIKDGLEMVKDEKVFGYIGALATIGYTIQNEFIGEVKIAGKFRETWELSIGVRNDDKVLLDILEKTIKSVNASKRQKIFNNWINISYKEIVDYSLFYVSLFAIILIWIFFSYKQYLNQKLKSKLEEKIQTGIQELRDKDKMLFQQSKLASMGEMLENIAHQWRQPLSQINSSVLVIDHILHERNFKDTAVENKLLAIESLTNYLSNTINDFKQFFDPNKEKEHFVIQELLDQSIFILQDTIVENKIDIQIESKEKINYYGYKNELQQVILVLLNNAKDIFLYSKIKDSRINISFELTDSYYCIFICDNAGGIKKEIMDKIFEPYFTTKYKSQGTGIGLSMANKIIQESFEGSITVENNNNDGACFNIKIKRND